MEIRGINTLCRICLHTSYIYSNIFHGHSTDSNPIYQVINYVYDLKICVGDGFPEYVCQNCLCIVRDFQVYKMKAQAAKMHLISWKEKFDLECGSGEFALKQDEQEIVPTQIAARQGEVEKKEDDRDDVSEHPVFDDNPILENQVFVKQEDADENEGVNDDPLHSVFDDSTLLQNKVQECDIEMSAIKVKEEESNGTQEEPDESGESNVSRGDSAFVGDPLAHNQISVKDEDIEIEEKSPFSEERISGESSQGEELADLGGRSDVSRGEKVTCHHCGEEKDTKEEISDHIMKVHGYGREEEDRAREREQSRKQSGGKKHVCSVCGKGNPSCAHLVMHMRVHTKEKPYQCSVCDKRFSIKGNLTSHMITHRVEKSLKCSECDYRCNIMDYLKRHMVIHLAIKGLKCSECDYSCKSKRELKSHMVVHQENKPLKCPTCDYVSKRKQTLRKHMITHQEEKNFKCSECGYRCKVKQDLKGHMATHQTEKSVKCPECDYRCKRKKYLKPHMLVHQTEKHIKCPECAYRCKRRSTLRKHMKSMHE